MKRTYKRSQRLMAFILLACLCLQSCNNPLTPVIPNSIREVPSEYTSSLTDHIQPLVGQELTVQGGHTITFYEEVGKLKADVAMDLPEGFSKIYKGLEVAVEQGAELAKLPCLDAKAQQHRIHLQLAQGSQPAKVIIYKGSGLTGGGQDSDEGNYKKYKKEADQGHAHSQYNLGWLYKKGKGVEQSDAEAVKWFRKAAQQKHKRAQYNLALMYEEGKGIGQSDEEAVEWFQKAADQGHTDAQYRLGRMYKNGWGENPENTKDDEKAVEWFQKAADQGHTEAQYNLGWMYEKGKGVGHSDEEAVEWFQKAADQKYADAQYRLGRMYKNGWGENPENTKDDEKAVEWFQKAAGQEHADAQYRLGRMYKNGWGENPENTKDDEEAVEW
ncbi:MAG: tetratricopeptide repeat protein, partial [Candidatus Amoebophilus sp.]